MKINQLWNKKNTLTQCADSNKYVKLMFPSLYHLLGDLNFGDINDPAGMDRINNYDILPNPFDTGITNSQIITFPYYIHSSTILGNTLFIKGYSEIELTEVFNSTYCDYDKPELDYDYFLLLDPPTYIANAFAALDMGIFNIPLASSSDVELVNNEIIKNREFCLNFYNSILNKPQSIDSDMPEDDSLVTENWVPFDELFPNNMYYLTKNIDFKGRFAKLKNNKMVLKLPDTGFHIITIVSKIINYDDNQTGSTVIRQSLMITDLK